MKPSSKFIALFLISMLFISSATPILGCITCSNQPPKHENPKPKSPEGPITLPPITLPPKILPPVIEKPPPPVVGPPKGNPNCPPPPVVGPPKGNPNCLPPPVVGPPKGNPNRPPASAAAATCPIDTLKLGACVDLLGGLVHIGLGDPVVNKCCPVLQGLVELEAAVCLCTTLKLKVINLNIFVPLALQLLLTCGKTPPPGFTCTL